MTPEEYQRWLEAQYDRANEDGEAAPEVTATAVDDTQTAAPTQPTSQDRLTSDQERLGTSTYDRPLGDSKTYTTAGGDLSKGDMTESDLTDYWASVFGTDTKDQTRTSLNAANELDPFLGYNSNDSLNVTVNTDIADKGTTYDSLNDPAVNDSTDVRINTEIADRETALESLGGYSGGESSTDVVITEDDPRWANMDSDSDGVPNGEDPDPYDPNVFTTPDEPETPTGEYRDTNDIDHPFEGDGGPETLHDAWEDADDDGDGIPNGVDPDPYTPKHTTRDDDAVDHPFKGDGGPDDPYDAGVGETEDSDGGTGQERDPDADEDVADDDPWTPWGDDDGGGDAGQSDLDALIEQWLRGQLGGARDTAEEEAWLRQEAEANMGQGLADASAAMGRQGMGYSGAAAGLGNDIRLQAARQLAGDTFDLREGARQEELARAQSAINQALNMRQLDASDAHRDAMLRLLEKELDDSSGDGTGDGTGIGDSAWDPQEPSEEDMQESRDDWDRWAQDLGLDSREDLKFADLQTWDGSGELVSVPYPPGPNPTTQVLFNRSTGIIYH